MSDPTIHTITVASALAPYIHPASATDVRTQSPELASYCDMAQFLLHGTNATLDQPLMNIFYLVRDIICNRATYARSDVVSLTIAGTAAEADVFIADAGVTLPATPEAWADLPPSEVSSIPTSPTVTDPSTPKKDADGNSNSVKTDGSASDLPALHFPGASPGRVRTSVLKRQGAFYGTPDWEAMANVYSHKTKPDPPRTMGQVRAKIAVLDRRAQAEDQWTTASQQGSEEGHVCAANEEHDMKWEGDASDSMMKGRSAVGRSLEEQTEARRKRKSVDAHDDSNLPLGLDESSSPSDCKQSPRDFIDDPGADGVSVRRRSLSPPLSTRELAKREDDAAMSSPSSKRRKVAVEAQAEGSGHGGKRKTRAARTSKNRKMVHVLDV